LFSSLQHLATRQHQRNIRAENYIGIDSAIACGQTLSSFCNAYWRESRDAETALLISAEPDTAACSQPDIATPLPSKESVLAPTVVPEGVVEAVTPCASVRETECDGSVSSVFRGFALDEWDPFEPRYCQVSDDGDDSLSLRQGCSPVFGTTLPSLAI